MVDGAWPAVLAVALGAVVVAIVGLVVLRRRFVVVTVRGPSMEPALWEGDRVLVRRREATRLRAGDLVVFAEAPEPPHIPPQPADRPVPVRGPRRPWQRRARGPRLTQSSEGWLVKRAVAVAGDPVPRDAGPALAVLDDEVVPPDCLVALGDNASASYDSRHYGYVSADRLLGVVLRRI